MHRILLFSASFLLLNYVSAAPFGEFSSSPNFENFKKMLPSQVTEAYQNLSPQEKQALREVFRNYRNYHNEQEFIAALKQKSPSLGARAEKMFLQLQRRIGGLSEEPKAFVENLMATARELHAEHLNGGQIDRAQLRQVAMGIMGQYRSMSPYAQEELRQAFPEVVQFMAQARSQGIRGIFQRFMNGGQ